MPLSAATAGLLAFILASPASADCRLELELLGHDLHDKKLTDNQKFNLAAQVDLALKHCRTGQEQAAMEDIAKARRVADIPKQDLLDEVEQLPAKHWRDTGAAMESPKPALRGGTQSPTPQNQ